MIILCRYADNQSFNALFSKHFSVCFRSDFRTFTLHDDCFDNDYSSDSFFVSAIELFVLSCNFFLRFTRTFYRALENTSNRFMVRTNTEDIGIE